MTPKLLLVEDDAAIAEAVAGSTRADGYEVVIAENGVEALIAASAHSFDVAAIDVMLPEMDGFELCRRLRERGERMPILMLTARDAIADRVRGLDAGADDYLTKPFAFPELAARLRALVRRHQTLGQTDLRAGDLVLHLDSDRAEAAGTSISLTGREFQLLRLLASQPDEIITRDMALDDVWGTRHVDAAVVDQYIGYLRRKLSGVGASVRIDTVRGRGYSLRVDDR